MLGDPRPAPHPYGGRGLTVVCGARLLLQGSSVCASAQTPTGAPRRIGRAGQCAPAAGSLGARGMGCAWDGPSRPGGTRPAPELGSDRPSQVKTTWRVVGPATSTVWELGAIPIPPPSPQPTVHSFSKRPWAGPTDWLRRLWAPCGRALRGVGVHPGSPNPRGLGTATAHSPGHPRSCRLLGTTGRA